MLVLLKIRLMSRIVINHPLNAKFVFTHSEIRAPKSVRKRHFHFSAFRKSVENRIGFSVLLALDGDRKIIACNRILPHRFKTVGCHQNTAVADWAAPMCIIVSSSFSAIFTASQPSPAGTSLNLISAAIRRRKPICND
jgi:hypothetical protein